MKTSFILRIFLVLIILAWSGLVFVFGFYQGYQQIPEPPQGLETQADITLLWDVWNKLQDKYIGSLDHQKMIYGAARGMVESLEDPYTVFFKPSEGKIFKEDIAGSFEGVGMEITVKEGQLTVVAPLEGTPAKRAGLMPGDKVIKVDDVFTKDISIDEAVKLIRGEKGTAVNLSILRDDWDKPRVFEVIRDVIQIPNLKLEILEQGIAKVNIYQFNSQLSSQFRELARDIVDSRAKKIILDLRNNPGGLLGEAQSLAGWFLAKGSVVTIEDKGEKGEKQEYLATGNEMFLNYPVVILINQGTASGAEILAAALRDNKDKVKLIGEKTFGKGSVQEPVDIRGGSLLKITVAHWLTPKGQLIDGVGLEPDIEVKMSAEDYEQGRDPQLQKAIEVLKTMEL